MMDKGGEYWLIEISRGVCEVSREIEEGAYVYIVVN